MRFAVTGANGLLGPAVVAAARAAGHEVVAIRGRSGNENAMNLLDADAPSRLVAERPDWIVNCAAIVDVDWCEAHAKEAFALNAEVPNRIATAAEAAGIGVVQVSTDSVFDGARGRYTEDDEPRPVNTYARTKLQAERMVMDAAPKAAVLRTNMFGAAAGGRQGLAEWILSKLGAGESLPGFTDVRFSPLYIGALGRTIVKVAETKLSGLYHAGAADGMSKYEFARTLATAFGYVPELIRAASSDDATWTAQRPQDTTLVSSRLAHALGERAPSIEEGVLEFRAQLRNAAPADEESQS